MKVNTHAGNVNTHTGKTSKSVHVQTGIAVHIQPVWVFTFDRYGCSPSAGICNLQGACFVDVLSHNLSLRQLWISSGSAKAGRPPANKSGTPTIFHQGRDECFAFDTQTITCDSSLLISETKKWVSLLFAVVREFAEETGLTVKVDKLIAIDSLCVSIPGWSPMHSIRITYSVTHESAELCFEQQGNTYLCTWHSHNRTKGLPLVDLARRGIEYVFG